MQGINYVTDAEVKCVAVQIDLKKHREVWEDFFDVLTAQKATKRASRIVGLCEGRPEEKGRTQ